MLLRPASPARATVRNGKAPTAQQHNALVQLTEQTTMQRGPLRGRRMPDGFTPRVSIKATLSVDYNFRVTLSEGKTADEWVVSFTPGDVAGIIPEIDGVALDDVDEANNPPQLTVKPDDWRKVGNVSRTLIMFHYELEHSSFVVQKVTPIAVPRPPDAKPWEWNKLVAFLTRSNDGTVKVTQRVFFSQAFDVANSKPNGTFTPLPHLAS